MIDRVIDELVDYGIERKLLEESDAIYSRNQILEILKKEDYTETDSKVSSKRELEFILKDLLDYAVNEKIIEDNVVDRDLLDTKIMNTLISRPSEIIAKFNEEYKKSPVVATDYYYKFSKDSDYIRTYRISKDIKWKVDTKYGELDITINLSKPEKDPKAIAAAKNAKQSGYPKCLLCKENVGYSGRKNHPARQNLRIIPVKIQGLDWFMQYSPYVYYNEHCIVFNGEHTPMKIEKATFQKLFDFVKHFPHYILGSNADLPIVGGSILSHDHFQGGHYEFAMAKAPIESYIPIKGYEDIKAGIVKWPMSVIRLTGKDSERVIELADKILNVWRGYTDSENNIFAYTDNEPHNTITPIARKKDENFELDLVLRNNITTKERPDGLYHPRKELHHIKKENIGLIEVMGLAILPSRLKTELAVLSEFILEDKDILSNEDISKHASWAEEIKNKYKDLNKENIDSILKNEVGLIFKEVLEDCGVYKCNENGRKGFLKFFTELNR
jgi:UTP--hexose-1-phosphate uridylyltransferase